MLWNIAWRNVWRNRSRSLVVMTAIIIGLWAGTFILAWSFGAYDQRLRSSLNTEISDIQLHRDHFKDDYAPKLTIPAGDSVLSVLQQDPQISAVCGRVVAKGMASSSRGAGGIQINGVDPASEMKVTDLHTKITEGGWFDCESRRPPVVIGQALAEKLKLKLRSQFVLTFQNTEGDISSLGVRVCGIYKTSNRPWDETQVYIPRDKLAKGLLLSGGLHEIALMTFDGRKTQSVATHLQSEFPNVKVEDWRQISPELELMIESSDQYINIFIGIILLGLAFGIINTMLMAVLDRVREIGMLMAIGMNRKRLFAMIVLETLFLVMAASPVGLLLAWGTIAWFGQHGVNLTILSKGWESFGFDPIVYPLLEKAQYLRILWMVLVTAILSAIYPAITALRLKPVEAIRKI